MFLRGGPGPSRAGEIARAASGYWRREAEAQRDIPCIVMSSMREANARERIDAYAAFVRKPFQLTAVVQLVARVLSVPRPGT